MLRSSLRCSNGRLIAGRRYCNQAIHKSFFPQACAKSASSGVTQSWKNYQGIASMGANVQKRLYAVAAEEANKGVVSGQFQFVSYARYLCLIIIHRTQTILFYRAILPIMWTKCTCSGNESPRASTSRGKSTSGTWRMETCQYHKLFNPRQP